MSEFIKCEGPYAFPASIVVPTQTGYNYVFCPGMTLQDWMASQAMVGILSNKDEDHSADYVASMAYYYADAMLAVKQKRLVPEKSEG